MVEIPKVYEQLKQVRASTTVTLKPTSMLRKEFAGLDGEVRPLTLRYYQVQAIFHMLALKRMVLGDPTGSGKTLVTIASLCYAWDKEPDNKVVVVCPKSARRQWASEVDKFSTGVTCYIVDGTPNERKQAYLEFVLHKGPTKAVMITGYAPLVRDWYQGAHQPLDAKGKPDMKQPMVPGMLDGLMSKAGNLTVIFDEAHAFKSDRTKTWQVCGELSARANRCYGLTATLMKNRLIEGFAVYKVIYPQVFTTKSQFMKDFCVTQLQKVGGGRKIPIIVGYKNLQGFRNTIDPYYLGRLKHEISSELPKLTTREVLVEMSAGEDAKYSEALSGIISLGDGDVKDYSEHKALTALIYCQKTVDSLSLLKYSAGDQIDLESLFVDSAEVSEVGETGSKEQALLDLLSEEFDDEKVIVYCRFASLIPRLQELCAKAGIPNVAITGAVVDTKNNPARANAQKAFQDLKSDIRVIFISDAGSESINLQAASAMIFYNAPWSWGSYVQLLGRPIRIGSPHERVVAVHLVAERPKPKAKDRKTIDHYTLAILQKKKSLIDSVLGEAAVGALDFGGDSFALELSSSLKGSR